jgi:putative tryptophan/tyrosine transport system substrate-binding protein
MRRREIITLLGGAAAAWPLAARAQQPSKVPRIGSLGFGSAAAFANRVESLRAGLRDLGYVEARTLSSSTAGRKGSISCLSSRPNWSA